MPTSDFKTYGTSGDDGNGEEDNSWNTNNTNNINSSDVNDILGMLVLNSPGTQILWASQFLVCCGFSQAETLIMMLGIDEILDAQLFPVGGEIEKMIHESVLMMHLLETEDDPFKLRIMKIDFELLAFIVTYKIDEYIEADRKKRGEV